jgi:hypothetical protein
MRSRNLFRELTVFLITSLAAATACAVPVSITGGFTSFSSSGVFGTTGGTSSTLNGNPLCPDAGCDTFGPANVTFGTPQSSVTFQVFTPAANPLNEVRFTPAAPQEVNGTGPANAFFLGTLLFTNGIWSALDASFGFTLTSHSSSAVFDNQTLVETLFMQVTSNDFTNKTPAQNADFVYALGTPAAGSLRAYELTDTPTGTNTATARVFGYFASLHLLGLTDPTGGFVDPGIALEPTVSVAEPGIVALLSLGLCALGFFRRLPIMLAASRTRTSRPDSRAQRHALA